MTVVGQRVGGLQRFVRNRDRRERHQGHGAAQCMRSAGRESAFDATFHDGERDPAAGRVLWRRRHVEPARSRNSREAPSRGRRSRAPNGLNRAVRARRPGREIAILQGRRAVVRPAPAHSSRRRSCRAASLLPPHLLRGENGNVYTLGELLQVATLIGDSPTVVGTRAVGHSTEGFLDSAARGGLAKRFPRPFEKLLINLDRRAPAHESILTVLRNQPPPISFRLFSTPTAFPFTLSATRRT